MKDKVIIITGGSSGIGKALAFALGREGAKIVITGRNKDTLAEVSTELKHAAIHHLAIAGDVSNEADNRAMVEQTVAAFGGIDILINNAGISMRGMVGEIEPSVIEQVMKINFFGTVYATHYALPYIKERKGNIVGISSIAGYRGLPVRSGYSASKFAMNGYLEALRTELLHSGVHVLTACPGFTTSNIRSSSLGKGGKVLGESMRDEGNMMTAEECADHIISAIKKRKRELVLTTQGKFTVLLNKWLPGLADKLVYNALKKEKNSPLK
jgi:short-subunit dehydrogenase